jgi:hypothetical protein
MSAKGCAQIGPSLVELARGRLLDAEEERGAREHLAGCAACRAHLEAERELSRALRWAAEADEADEGAGASPQVAVALREAFAVRQGPPDGRLGPATGREGVGTRARPRPRTLLLIAAAGLILALAAVLRPSARSTPGRTRTATRRPPPVVRVAERGDTLQLAPLYASPLTDVESGQVIRVGLPRSALRSMGWPLPEVPGGELVPAEVLLGEDGLARAVRLVK